MQAMARVSPVGGGDRRTVVPAVIGRMSVSVSVSVFDAGREKWEGGGRRCGWSVTSQEGRA